MTTTKKGLAAVALVLLLRLLAWWAFAVETAPNGWHDGSANTNPPVAWPASNRLDAFVPSGPVVTSVVCVTNISGTATNIRCVTNLVIDPITNFYRGYGTYTRLQTTIYTNWYYLTTNCVTGLSNGLPCVASGTNDGVEVTNFVGVSTLRPTNAGPARADLLRPGRYLSNVNVAGGVPYSTNTWLPDVRLSDSTQTVFRWAWLRATGPYVKDGVTSDWRTVDMDWAVLDGSTTFSVEDALYDLYLWSLVSSNGTSDWFTNYYRYSPLLTNNFITNGAISGGVTNFAKWTTPYFATNILLNVRDVQQLDIRQAFSERFRVLEVGLSGDLSGYQYWLQDWLAGVAPAGGYAYAGINPVWENCVQSKYLVQSLAPYFVVKELADTNGTFNDWFKITDTNWIWTTSNWVVSLDRYVHEDFPKWDSLRNYSGKWVLGGGIYAQGNYDTEEALLVRLGLPHAYFLYVASNTIPGFIVGVTNQTVLATFTNRTLYGSYFDYTPRKNYVAVNSNCCWGNGHVVSNTWTIPNSWVTGLTQSATNVLALNANPVLSFSIDSYSNISRTVSAQVWSVCSATTTCFTTNCTAGVTNGVLCATSGTNDGVIATNVCGVSFNVYHGSGFTTNTAQTLWQWTNVVLLSTNFVTSNNSVSVSTVITNYDIADGYHEVDYGWDGVRKVLNALTWTAVDASPYCSNWSEAWQWSIINTVTNATNVLGFVACTNHPNNSVGYAGEFVFFPPPGDTNDSHDTTMDYATYGPRAVRVDWDGKIAKVYSWQEIITTHAAWGGGTSDETNTGTATFWTAPTNFTQQAVFKDMSGAGDGTCSFGSQEWAWTFSFVSNTLVECGGSAWGLGCGGSTTGRVGGHTVSSAFVYPQACPEFQPNQSLYVKTERPASWVGNPGDPLYGGYWTIPPLRRDNDEYQIGTRTNIQHVALTNATYTLYMYVWTFLGATNNLPACIISWLGDNRDHIEIVGSGGSYGISANVSYLVGDGTIDTNLGWACYQQTNIVCFPCPPPQFMCCLTNIATVCTNYFYTALAEVTGAQVCDFTMDFNHTQVATTWECEQRYDTNGTPTIDEWCQVGSDCRGYETNYTAALWRTYSALDDKIVKWDAAPYGLAFDITNDVGYWQSVGSGAGITSTNSDLTFQDFVSPILKTNEDTHYQVHGWGVNSGKVLLKWDANASTNGGFKYR